MFKSLSKSETKEKWVILLYNTAEREEEKDFCVM